MRTVIDGVEIHYELEGPEGAPCVLLLHGWGGCIGSMGPVKLHLLSLGRRTLALDFPGHGESGEPPCPWSVTEYTDLTLKLLDELGIEKCDIVAHSFGGRVSILLSSRHPQRIGKMALTGAAGLIPKRGAKYYLRVYKHKLGKKLAKIRWINRLFHLDEKARNAGSADYRSLKSDVMRGTFVRVVNQDLKGCLKAIQAPTLLIWGSEDDQTPLYFGQIMEKNIPDAGLVVFEGAGHFAYLEQSQRFCKILTSFFGGEAA
jgi:pimeloyl-ACP methyl ester carboxylesterase